MRDDPPSNLPGPTRRTLLRTTGETAAAAVIAGCAPGQATSATGQSSAPPAVAGAVPVTLRINGRARSLRIGPRTTLLGCMPPRGRRAGRGQEGL
jgi:xanthine dehydrogenase YagT iron-sulfur-binding subunit